MTPKATFAAVLYLLIGGSIGYFFGHSNSRPDRETSSTRSLAHSFEIPSIDFEDVPIFDAIDFLRSMTRVPVEIESGPKYRRLNFVLQDPNNTARDLNLRLQDIPLDRLCELIAEDSGLNVTFGEHAVIFSPLDPKDEQTEAPIPTLDPSFGELRSASKVVGYRFKLPGADEPDTPADSGFSFIQRDGTVRVERLAELKVKEATLTPEQIDRLVTAIYEVNEITSAAACYDPHHIFLFYDANGEVIHAIEICFSCTNLRALPSLGEDRWRRHDFRALARLCEEIGIGLGTRTAEEFIRILDERERL